MEIEFTHKADFKVVGINTVTTNVNESNPETAVIPGLWQQYFSENIENQITDKISDSPIIGLYYDYESTNERRYSLLVGNEVSRIEHMAAGLIGAEVPESDYLVFSDQGEMPAVIYSLWEFIRQYFSENKVYKRKYSYDFECYNLENTSKLSIYISVETSQ